MFHPLPRYLRPLVTCVLFFLSLQSHGQTAVPVAIATAEVQPVYREAQITGTVTSPQVAQLSVATAGLIVSLQAEEGDRLEQGDALLQLDDELARQQLAGARARVKRAEIALTDARRRLREAESLGPQGGIAETLIENARTEVAEDEAALAEFRAEAAEQQAIVARHTLAAPFTGIVSRRLTEVGEWVAPGSGVFELVATENLRLDFPLAEAFLTTVSAETEIRFRLNALPGESFVGRVKAIVPVTDPGARTFLLRVIPETAIPGMMPGLSANATLRNAIDRQAVVVPEDAVLRYPDARVVVWVVTGRGGNATAREQRVSVGESFDGLVVIHSGIDAGDRVVVRGNEALQEGQPVTVVAASESR